MSSYVNGPKLTPEESQRRVDEMRDKVTKKLNKWADRVSVSMAFKPKIDRQEGERWTEDGHTYVMKNGTRVQQSLMESVRVPVWCPRCSKAMNHRFDTKFYNLRGWCFNCNIDVEGEMRVNGTWTKFEKQVMRRNEVAFLKDKIEGHLTYINEFKEPTLYFEDGRWEVLATKDQFQKTFDELLADVDFMLSRLDAIQKEEEEENDISNTVVVEQDQTESIADTSVNSEC